MPFIINRNNKTKVRNCENYFIFVNQSVFITVKKDRFYYLSFLAMMLCLSLVIIAGPEVIFVRQLSEYAVHIMLFLFFLGFIFLFLSRSKPMFISFAACAALCVFIKNESNTDFLAPKENRSQKVRVAHINLSNIDDENLLNELINKDNYDLISFQEFTPEWRGILGQNLGVKFPYNKEFLRLDPHGKAIYSKYPVEIIDTLNKTIGQDLVLSINKNQVNYTFISTYLVPSLDNNSLNLAKLQMKNISQYIQSKLEKIIVMGDFNMVYWNQEIKQFRNATRLNNGRKDVIPVNLKQPYDQVFYTANLQCIGVKDILMNSKQRVGIHATFQENISTTAPAPKPIF